MFRILDFLRGNPVTKAPAASAAPRQPSPPSAKRVVAPGVPTYPPVDQGIPVESLEDVMATQVDILRRFQLISGMPHEDFERFYMRVLRNYAAFVHLLPCTRRSHYRGAGGLLRWGFEASFFSLQAAEGRIFSSSEGIEARRILEPRWRYATFLAALCSELARPMTDYLVVDEDGREWPSYEVGLMEWCARNGVTRYMIRWSEGSADVTPARRGSPAYVLPKIIPSDAMQYLQEGHPRIATAMMAVITQSLPPGEELAMAAVVRSVSEKLIEKDRALSVDYYGEMVVGAHLEPHLVDGMRRLIRSGKWKINKGKPRLWYGTDGLFLVWGATAKDELLAELGDVKGIPRDEATLLDQLIKAKVFTAAPGAEPSWTIAVPAGDAMKELKAIRIANPHAVLPAEPAIAPLEIALAKSLAVNAPAAKPSRATPQVVTIASSAADPEPSSPEAVTEAREGAGDAEEANDAAAAPADQAPEPAQADAAAPPTKADGLLQSLPATVAETIKALVEDTLAGNPPAGTAFTEKKGFAITAEAVATYGVDAAEFGKALHTAGWLEVDEAKPERAAIMTTIDGKSVRAFVLKPRKAKDLGFVQGGK